ncbi:MAG: cyclic nucleotide-binding domain-containing protein [Gemmatimonadota bacterium]|nr:cyclic nucleotide-binding domain-containing protein [Gemmatimonadota bacterium]
MAKKANDSKKIQHKKIVEDLSKYDFFSTFSFEEISLLLFCAEQVSCTKDEIIFKEGDIGKNFYAIVSGEIIIRKETSGHELARFDAGQVFGEMAVLDHHPRSATAVAATDVELFAFNGRRLLDDFPHLSVKLLRYLSRELSKRLRDANILIDRY